MKQFHQYSTYWLPVVVLVCSSLIPHYATAAASYLQELKVDANWDAAPSPRDGGKSSPSVQTQAPAALPKQTVNPASNIKAGLSQEEFENQLQQNYYGSYLFYSTLLLAQRNKVYEEYKEDNDIESIRKSIMSKLKK